MHPLLLNTYDILGGAARAAYRLHTGLRQIGCESQMLVAAKSSHDPTVTALAPSQNLPDRVKRRIERYFLHAAFQRYQDTRPAGYDVFSQDRTLTARDLLHQLPPHDLINLHWVAGLVDVPSFMAAIAHRVPMVWTLHDMNPLTGGCHYNDGCGKFRQHCGACPQLGSTQATDLSRTVWKRKQKAYQHLAEWQLSIVTPCQWMADQVRQSSLLQRFPLKVIPYGLDTTIFAPKNRTYARKMLDIPEQAQVILFVADNLIKQRKGLRLLIEALGGLDQTVYPNLLLFSVGSSSHKLDLPIPQFQVGRLDDDRLLAMIYSAANMFVIPSIQDNLPNTVLEAMACGVPVVGFATGGIPDMVRPGHTGLLVPTGNVLALRSAIKQLLDDPTICRSMAVNARYIAANEYALEVQARRYRDLYAELIEQWRTHSVVN